jgi:hypothetical protein
VINERDPEAWVGVGGGLTTALLIESGVEGYNGTQPFPSREMWDDIDPSGKFEHQWNRLGAVQWVPAPGNPMVDNPYADVIRVTFDACSRFAQANVGYVLSEGPALTSQCLRPLDTIAVPDGELNIYRVISAGER